LAIRSSSLVIGDWRTLLRRAVAGSVPGREAIAHEARWKQDTAGAAKLQ
jgi:hypothetical protein